MMENEIHNKYIHIQEKEIDESPTIYRHLDKQQKNDEHTISGRPDKQLKNEVKRKDCLEDCTLCPRECHVNRKSGQRGYCGQTQEIRVARAALHMWEEPCISGENGSGTIFFSGCTMGCVYCQNHSIAKGLSGKNISTDRLVQIMLKLQEKRAHNINLVTPSHYSIQIKEAIQKARKKGLVIPIVYNCSGYEKVETLCLLNGYVDIYLPDFKYMDSAIAEKYSNCRDYFQYASEALTEMVKQTGEPEFDKDGMMKKGVIVRHLVLPGQVRDSKRLIKYLNKTYHNQIFISIMNQYTPMEQISNYPELNRRITRREYNEVVDYAIDIGVEDGFIQEGETASESFIPPFNNEGV